MRAVGMFLENDEDKAWSKCLWEIGRGTWDDEYRQLSHGIILCVSYICVQGFVMEKRKQITWNVLEY